jgi:hypothetical protein
VRTYWKATQGFSIKEVVTLPLEEAVSIAAKEP